MTASSNRREDPDEPKLDGNSETRESAGSDGGPSNSSAGSEDDSYESWLREAAVADPPSRIALPQIGQVISGKYRIEQELGRGGMGAVYRATHVVSDKAVALKWMLRSASDKRAKERFTREARAAGRIDHPNVVDVYDIGEDGDAAYLVMELLRGRSLRQRLTSGPLELHESVDLLIPAMRGVAAANRQGVIHRDLKPDNIFLCIGPDGEPREAKVLDFGISTINEPDSDSQPTLTKEGTLLGTPAYMSPEQLENPRNLDARADVYALGVIVYECLTGKLPFEADNYSALVLAIAKGNATPLRRYRPELPAELEAVVLRALSQERFESVDELIDALSPFSTLPSESRVSQALEPPPSKSRLSLAVTVALAVAVGLGAWTMTRTTEPVGTTSPSTEELAERALDEMETPDRSASPSPPAETQPSPTAHPSPAMSSSATSATATINFTGAPTATSQPEPKLAAPAQQPKRVAKSPSAKKSPRSDAPASSPVNAATPSPKTPGRSGSISPDDL